MAHPAPDPVKLLATWMEWERGETPPGRVMSTMKTGGLRLLLEELASAAPSPVDETGPDEVSTESWTPVV